MTLNADNETYSGNPYNSNRNSISYDKEEETKWNYAGLKIPDVQYKQTKDSDGQEVENAELTNNRPTAAGTYEASITCTNSDSTTVTATDTFIIEQKSLEDAEIMLAFNKQKQTGETIEQSIHKVKSGVRELVLGTDYEVVDAGSVMSASAVGTYTITIEGKGNYKDTAKATWQITERNVMEGITKTEVTASYTGQPYSAKVSVNTPSDAEITYCATKDGEYTNTPPGYTAVGEYTIYYKITHLDYETETGTVSVKINPGTKHPATVESLAYGKAAVYVNGAVASEAGYGSEVTLVATPDQGYQFKRWIVSQGAVTIANNKFTMPNSNVHVQAEFEEIPGGSGSGGSGGSGNPGGSGTVTPPTEPAETENYTIPVKNEKTVKVEAEITDGVATISEITADTLEQVVKNTDKTSKVDTIIIDLSGAKQEVTGVTLSKTTIGTLAETTAEKDNGIETVTVELSKASVVLDNKTLETLAEQAKGNQIELVVADTKQDNLNSAQQSTLNQYQVSTTFEAYFTSGGERIHDFNGGKAVVSIDFTPETGRDVSFYHLVYVAEDGKLTRYKTKYKERRLMFTTTHFSDYAVVYDTSEKNETEEQPGDDSDTDDKVTPDNSYRTLRLRVPVTTETTNVLKWKKVSGADGYVIYGNKCNTRGKTYKMVKQTVIRDNSVTSWTDENLDSGVYYKYYIKAYKLVDGKKVWLAKSKVVHSSTDGGKYGNAKALKVNETAVTLAVGEKFTIKAEQIEENLPIRKHTDIKFESGSKKTASVTRGGVIKAKKEGTCTIYVYAQNGMYRKVKVTVK